MSKFIKLNRETGKKVADATDSIRLREKAVMADLHFEMQVPNDRWRLLRRQVTGRKPRIPRKIKKAIARPCARSKWVARSVCFTVRLWRRYCESPMQPGQCRTLQARLLIYLTLNGCKYSWHGRTLKCEMPSGVRLAIFPVPKYYAVVGGQGLYLYGAAIYPDRIFRREVYFANEQAMYLYKRLGEHIRDKVEHLI